MKKYLFLALIIYIYYILITKHVIITQSIIEACNLFINKIFTSLFPILIISYIIIHLNIIKYISFFISPITNKLFNINTNLSNIFIISIFTGSPGNAKNIKEMYDNKLLTDADCNKILLFSHFSNPLFILSIVKYRPLLVLFSHYITNIIIGIIFRNMKCSHNNIIIKNNNESLSNIIFNSIKTSVSTLLFILGTVTTFYIITSILNIKILNIIFELSQGMNYINIMNITNKYKTILFGFLLSFGGLCIHFQVFGILDGIKIKYIPYLFSRLLHSIITILLILILY